MVVILALAGITLLCLGGVIYLAAHSVTVPDVLVATTGVAVGALGSILTARSNAGP